MTKQCHLVHLHQQTRALGDKTLLCLTRLVHLATFADYTASCINHTQDVMIKQRCLVYLHHETKALGDNKLLFLKRLVRLMTLADYTGSCINHTQGLVMKQCCLVHIHDTVSSPNLAFCLYTILYNQQTSPNAPLLLRNSSFLSPNAFASWCRCTKRHCFITISYVWFIYTRSRIITCRCFITKP